MNTQAVTQVAKFLGVSPNQIKRCEEWAFVLFVQVQGDRPRFVSKKVIQMESFEDKLDRLEREQDEMANKAHDLAMEIDANLSIDVPYDKLFSAAVEIIEGERSFEEVVKQFSSKKVIKRG